MSSDQPLTDTSAEQTANFVPAWQLAGVATLANMLVAFSAGYATISTATTTGAGEVHRLLLVLGIVALTLLSFDAVLRPVYQPVEAPGRFDWVLAAARDGAAAGVVAAAVSTGHLVEAVALAASWVLFAATTYGARRLTRWWQWSLYSPRGAARRATATALYAAARFADDVRRNPVHAEASTSQILRYLTQEFRFGGAAVADEAHDEWEIPDWAARFTAELADEAGAYVCAECGRPTTDAPCPTHQPFAAACRRR